MAARFFGHDHYDPFHTVDNFPMVFLGDAAEAPQLQGF